MKIKTPVIFQLEVTSKCNHHCIYCYNAKRRKSETNRISDPSLEVLKERIDILAANQIMSLAITGGEPTLRSDIHEIIGYASKRFPFVSVNTNGTFLKRLFNTSLPANVTVFLSMRGTRKMHKMITGASDFSAILSSIQDVNPKNEKIAANFVPTSINFHSLWDLAIQLSRVNITTLYISRLIRNPHLQITEKNMAHIIATLHRIRNELRFKIRFSTAYPLCFLGDDVSEDWIQGTMCPWGTIYGGVNVAGDVMPCPADDIFLGSIHRHSLRDLWKRAISMRQMLDAKRLEACEKCEIKEKCNMGCMADSKTNDPLIAAEKGENLKILPRKLGRPTYTSPIRNGTLLTAKSFVYRREGKGAYLVFAPGFFCGIVNETMLDLLKSMLHGTTLKSLTAICREKYFDVTTEHIREAIQNMITTGLVNIGDKEN